MNLKKSPRAILKQVLKYAGITVSVILLLFGIVSWVVVKNKNDWLLRQIQSVMNESQSGQLEIATTNLKLFRSFPDVTIVLGGINYYEHRDSMRLPGEKPILHADQLFVAIELLPLINDELKISEVSLSHAQLNVTEYQNGQLNIKRALAIPRKPAAVKKKIIPKTTPSTPSPAKKKITPVPAAESKTKPKAAIQIDLKTIALDNLHVTWHAYNSYDTSSMLIEELEVEMERDETIVMAQLNSVSKIQSLYINGVSIPKGNLTVSTAIQYDPGKQHLTIRKGEINYDIFNLELKGTYEHQKNQLLDLRVDASSNDLKLLSKIIKPEILKQNPDILKRGDIYIEGRIAGELKNHQPQFDISFGVRNLALTLPKNRGTFQHIGFDGKLTSGNLPDYSNAVIEIKRIRGNLPGGSMKGEFSLHNFVEPYLKYNLHAQLKLDGYDEVFQINSLKELSGAVSLEANFDGPLQYFAQHRMDSSRSSTVTLDSISFVLAKTGQQVSRLSGKIENRDNQTSIQQLAFRYGKNDLTLNATIDNLMHFLIKQERDIFATVNIQSSELHTKDFLFDTTSAAHIQDKIKNLSLDFQFSTTSKKNAQGKTVIADLSFDIKRLSAQLEELPDLNSVTAKGVFSKTDQGHSLNLQEFHAIMPHGKLDVAGDLLIPEKRLWIFNAKIKTNKFPWNYIRDLVAEIKSGAAPTAKNLAVNQMDILTANLDVSASVTTYPFDFNKLDIRNSRVNFSLPDSKTLSAEKINLSLENLRFTHPENSGAITGLKSTKGTLDFKQLQVPGMKPFDIAMEITGERDKLDISFVSEMQKSESEHGTLGIDISQQQTAYHLRYSVEGANLEHFIKKYYKRKLMKGNLDYKIDLQTKGSGWANIQRNTACEFEISGNSLRFYGVDIDKALKKYERSQNFNLTDLGAVLIAGPVGLIATKGTDFVALANVKLDSSKYTDIKTLYTRWKFEKEQLITEDVAFATTQNRIAFDGRIDFKQDSIPGITIAVVDKNGCSLMDQKLYGKVGAVKTGKLNITKTLLGSVINFVNVVVGKDCKPVYTGTVKAPVN